MQPSVLASASHASSHMLSNLYLLFSGQATDVYLFVWRNCNLACQQVCFQVRALGGARAGSRGYGLENLKRLLMHTSPPPVLS